MTVSPNIDLAEMVSILRKAMSERFGCDVETITVTSFGKPRIVIEPTNIVDCDAFRHRAKEVSA